MLPALRQDRKEARHGPATVEAKNVGWSENALVGGWGCARVGWLRRALPVCAKISNERACWHQQALAREEWDRDRANISAVQVQVWSDGEAAGAD